MSIGPQSARNRVTNERLRIQGHGPVAMALALWLCRQGLRADQFDWHAEQRTMPDWLGSRPIALSAGSIQLLERIIAVPARAPILDIDIGIDGHAGALRLSAREFALPALGAVVRYGELHRALNDACAQAGLVCTAEPEPKNPGLSILADGDAGENAQVLDFEQSALLAEICSEHDGAGLAFERFTRSGPLAMLPLPQAHRYALVWCDSAARCADRQAMTDQAFSHALSQAFGNRLGKLAVASTRSVSALSRRLRETPFDGQVLCIGNAAQTLHPVAGQGLNLGLRDAFELAQTIGEARTRGLELGSAADRYVRARAPDRRSTVRTTDTLALLFSGAPARALGSLALAALDLAPPVRRAFARRFMFGLR